MTICQFHNHLYMLPYKEFSNFRKVIGEIFKDSRLEIAKQFQKITWT